MGVPYVMVPVPEEHVTEVLRYVVRLTVDAPAEPLEPWDEDAVVQLFNEASPPTQALLSYLAHPGRAGVELRPKDVADGLGLQQSDVPGIIGPLNRQCRRARRPPLVESRAVTVTSRTGKHVKRRTLVMHDDIAGMVRRASPPARRSRRSR